MPLTEKIEGPREFPPELLNKVAGLPTKPGVYRYFDEKGKIIYIGKAKNLRARVRSYFRPNQIFDAKTTAMLPKIRDIEVIVVDSEAEAFILEDTLIKKFKPRYNIELRDDKSYPYVRVTKEPYPRIFSTRTIVRDGSKYIGPFTEVRNLNQVLRTIRTIFRLRSCDLNITQETIDKKKHKACLDYHIEKCDGPCEGLISEMQYNSYVKLAVKILNGHTREVEKFLEEQMEYLAEEMRYEEAATTRNKLAMVKDFSSKQKIVLNDFADRDIFGIARIDDSACSIVLKIREGKLTGKKHYIVKKAEGLRDEAIIKRTLERWYIESEFIPKQINLPAELDDMELITDWLGRKSGHSVQISIPKIGDKRKLIEMANSNAEYILKEFIISIDKREAAIPRMVISLQRDLRMKKPPRHIECFDNSHIQGSELVSSMVYFEDGKPKKSEYKKFKARTVHQNDDFAMMREAVHRRYKRLIEEKKELPDLIIIDGGKGQLSSAYSVLMDLKIQDKVMMIGLAKRLEEVFLPGERESLILPKTSGSLKLIQQLRDEAHRTAVTFHRSLRDKRTLNTELTEIPGIGKVTAQRLLSEIGSVAEIREATKEELAKILNENQLKALWAYFHPDPFDIP